jgi:hypothetical protein
MAMLKFAPFAICLVPWLSLPIQAQSPKAKFLEGRLEVCEARLADGTPYNVYGRALKARRKGEDVYADLQAYYMTSSGEFLWRETIYSEQGYLTTLKERSNQPRHLCNDSYHHIVQLRDSEWADFSAEDDRITAFHSDLRFPSIERAWRYVSEHWEDGSWDAFRSTKWCEWTSLYNELGHDFFRPERLRLDARPFSYDSLLSATKVGSNWELEIKGADDPNRALVLLDRNFKLLKVTRTTPN